MLAAGKSAAETLAAFTAWQPRLADDHARRHLAGLVCGEEGVFDLGDFDDIGAFDINEDEVGAAPKVRADRALQTLVFLRRNGDSCHLFLPRPPPRPSA